MNTQLKALLADSGLLVSRIMLAAVGVYHGLGKLFVEGGFSGFTQALKGMGVPMPGLSAAMAAGTEFVGGLLILVGLGTRLVAIPWVFNFLVAFFVGHKAVFSAQKGGGEYALSLAVFGVALALTGPGRFSLDSMIFAKKGRSA